MILYLGQKYSLYVFLVERTHSVQASRRSRLDDYPYLAGHILVFFGFGLIGIATLVFRIATFDSTTGTCLIGIPRPITSIFLGWDLLVNVFLTVVFLRRCQPYMVKGMKATFIYPALRVLVTKLTFCGVNAFKDEDDFGISQDVLVRVIRKAFVSDPELGIESHSRLGWEYLIPWFHASNADSRSSSGVA